MRPLLMLAAGLGLAIGAPGLAQAQGFAPCGNRVMASGWATSPGAASTFRYRVTLMPNANMRVQVRFNMQYATQDAALNNPLNLRAGQGTTIWLGTGRANPPIAAVVSSTTLTCAPA